MASAPPRDRQLQRTGPLYQRLDASAPASSLAAPDARLAAPQARGVTPAFPPPLPREAVLLPRTAPIPLSNDAIANDAIASDALVLEPAAPVATPLHAARPSAGELLLHPFKALYIVTALLVDRRVGFGRKLAFAVPIALLVAGLLIPETLVGVVSGLVAPVIGLALNLPIDAGIDWLGVGLLSYALLRVFPPAIVAQYHAQLFHRASARHRV